MSTPGRAIVVGIDGSEPARAALRWAVRQSALTGAPVHAVAVWRQPSVLAAPDGTGMSPVIPDADLEAQAGRWLEEALATLSEARDDGPGDGIVTPSVRDGDPREVLLELGRDAELLVLGNKARGAIAGAIAGSVAQHCLHHARCPVLLVPADDPPSADPTNTEAG